MATGRAVAVCCISEEADVVYATCPSLQWSIMKVSDFVQIC